MFGSLVPWRRTESNLGPQSAVTEFRREMDNLFASFFGDLTPSTERFFGIGFSPDFDMSDTDNEVLVKADLPGVDPKDVEISLTGNTLTIRGERKEEKEQKGDNVYRRERRYGGFCRSFSLSSDVREDKIDAAYKNGVLTRSCPRLKEASAR